MYTVSDSGWMETDTFIQWFKNVFLHYVKDLEGPKILFLDGHSSRASIDFINLANDNNIHIICLPSHSSHALQPLDVGVFKDVSL